MACSTHPVSSPVIAHCGCGRSFTAQDWLDLYIVGVQESGTDYSMLDLRNCPCRSTIAIEVPLCVNPEVGLGPHLGTRPLLALCARLAPTLLPPPPPEEAPQLTAFLALLRGGQR